jgi:hypothetical protein
MPPPIPTSDKPSRFADCDSLAEILVCLVARHGDTEPVPFFLAEEQYDKWTLGNAARATKKV